MKFALTLEGEWTPPASATVRATWWDDASGTWREATRTFITEKPIHDMEEIVDWAQQQLTDTAHRNLKTEETREKEGQAFTYEDEDDEDDAPQEPARPQEGQREDDPDPCPRCQGWHLHRCPLA